MSRHGRNCTAGAVYTYHERQKDTKSGGYGLQEIRISKDSINGFNACCLTLQPCKTPMVTPEGYLYDREAIIEYIFNRKKEYSRRLLAWQNRVKRISGEESLKEKSETNSKITKFKRTEGSILPSTPAVSSESNPDKQLNSFWIPTLTPQAASEEISKPNKTIYCPMSGNPISLRDLVKVCFKTSGGEQSHFVCAVTGDTIGNHVPCAVLRSTGDVVTLECVDKLIRPGLRESGEMTHPISGEALEEKDIIKLKSSGTGFSGSGVSLKASKKGPSLMF